MKKPTKKRPAKQSGAARVGRPPKQPSERYKTPAMQLGRVPLETQQTLRQAARRAGETFTKWATTRLIEAAEREAKES